MSRICRQHDILLHADEVVTGFGRTGEWFGSFTYDLQPDILTMAKGLSSGYQPISAVSLGARMGEVIAGANEELVHGYTYSGHPVASAVALKNIEVLERKRIVQRVKRVDRPLLPAPRAAGVRRPPLVGEVRGIGLLAAIELVEDKKERRPFPRERNVGTICRDHCFKNGLVMRAIRDTMVLSPPLVITEAEVERAAGEGEALHRPHGGGSGNQIAPQALDVFSAMRVSCQSCWTCSRSRKPARNSPERLTNWVLDQYVD